MNKPHRYQLLVFDWDGTLCDSLATIVDVFQTTCDEFHLAKPAEKSIRDTVGYGIAGMLDQLLPEISPQQKACFVERYRFIYFTKPHAASLFAGVKQTLQQLHQSGYLLAVATGKSSQGLQLALQQTELQDMFVTTRTAEQTHSKPDPLMLDEIMNQCATGAEHTLMIGDSDVDMQLAVNAGVAVLAVSYGAHNQSVFAEYTPIAVIDSFHQLLNHL